MEKQYSLQSLILNSEQGADEKTSLLYHRGNLSYVNNDPALNSDEMVSFDTYFNMLYTGLFRQYTSVEKIVVAVTLQGKGRIELLGVEPDNKERLIADEAFDCKKHRQVELLKDYPLSEIPDNCFIRIYSEELTQIKTGGLYTTEKPQVTPNFACCFCTYKREKEIQRNVKGIVEGILENPASVLHGNTEVYIADNGHTLTEEMFFNDDVHVFENKNYGGSAGFTRCMIESQIGKNKGKHSHVVLMDDDALIYPEILERTAKLIRYLKPEYQDYFIGGAMLSLQEPNVQVENGSIWTGTHNTLVGEDVDLRMRENLLLNQNDAADYNAWFYSCIPSGFIKENNLPLPLFIHGDDINYGLRGNALIRMNGICIWHPDPRKSQRPYMEYYNARNYLIVDTKTSVERTALKTYLTELKPILSNAVRYRYAEAQYRIRGCDDYLRGIDWLKKLDAEENNNSVMKWIPSEKISISGKDSIIKNSDNKKIELLMNWIMPAKNRFRAFSADIPWDKMRILGTKRYAIVDMNTMNGLVYEKSYRKMLSVMAQSTGLFFKFLTRYENVSREWDERKEELELYKYWKDYLNI